MNVIHLLVFTIGNFIQLVQGAPSQIEWLLKELNGAHLRLSASAVCYRIILNIQFQKIINYLFISQDPPLVTEQKDFNGNVTYQGYVVEIADYMAKALNVT